MHSHPRSLVTALALLCAGSAWAEDAGGLNPGGTTTGGAPVINAGDAPGGGTPELTPGQRFNVNSSRQVEIRGLIDMDALIQDNYTDASNNNPDHRGFGLLRADLGAKVTLDERVAAVITLGYYSELGQSAPTTDTVPSDTFPQDVVPTQRRGTGQAVVDEAYVQLQQFLSIPELGVEAGRQPFAWNLRRNQGAWLYDSRAYDPAVTSWDGAKATYNFDDLDITPYSFRLPDNSTLYGGGIDFHPSHSGGSNRTFLTGSVNLERNVTLRGTAFNPAGGTGSKLITYYVGGEFDLNDFVLYGEYATQRGTETGSITFDGWGANAGLDWKTRLGSGQQFVLGIKGDYLSGENDPNDTKNSAFINNWSGESDTYIVESYKYGQIDHYLQGNLEDVKGMVGIAFDDHNRIRLSGTYGYYRMPRPMAGSPNGFGQEADLTLTWQYTYYSTFKLFGGIFRPSSGFDHVAPVGPTVAGTDPIYLLGLNLLTQF